MKKLKDWAHANSWWLPWVGVVISISGLLFPNELVKAGQAISNVLEILSRYWMEGIIIGWAIYLHIEIRVLKKRKRTRKGPRTPPRNKHGNKVG